MKKFKWVILYFEPPKWSFCSVVVGGLIKTLKEVKLLKKDITKKVISFGLVKIIRNYDEDENETIERVDNLNGC